METLKLGQVLRITESPVKANIGTFIVSLVFPQPSGNDYIQMRRLGRDGKVLLAESTNNHRSKYMSVIRSNHAAGRLELLDVRTDVDLNPGMIHGTHRLDGQ